MKNKFIIAAFIASLFLVFSCGNPSGGKTDNENGQDGSQVSGENTTQTGTLQSENPIKFSVNIPASTNSVSIERREVNSSSHEAISEWVEVGNIWIDDSVSDFSTAKTKDYTEYYEVEKDHCYEYQVWTYNDASGYDSIVKQSLGYHLAGYDGARFPEIKSENLPLLEFTRDDGDNGQIVFKDSSAEKPYLNVTYYNNEVTPSATLSLSYAWKYWTFVNQNGYFGGPISLKNLNKGNNNLTSANLVIDLGESDYFSFTRPLDLNYLMASGKIPVAVYGTIEEGEYGIDMAVSYLPGSVQVFIERLRLESWSDGWDKPWETIGFHHYDGTGYYDDFDFTDYFDYEQNKPVVYRARFVQSDWTTNYYADIGGIVPTKAGAKSPTFATGKAPKYKWAAETKTLSITNANNVELTFTGTQTKFVEGAEWYGGIGLSYKINGEGNYFPNFQILGKKKTDETSVAFEYVMEEDWGSRPDLSEDSSQNALYEYNIFLDADDKITYLVDLFGDGSGLEDKVITELTKSGNVTVPND